MHRHYEHQEMHQHPGMYSHPGQAPHPTEGEGCGCHHRPHHHGLGAGSMHYSDHDRAPRAEGCTFGCNRGPDTVPRRVGDRRPRHLGFRRRLFTREEKIARLLRYLDALYAEAEAVEERLADLGLDLEALDEEELDEEGVSDAATETPGDETVPDSTS